MPINFAWSFSRMLNNWFTDILVRHAMHYCCLCLPKLFSLVFKKCLCRTSKNASASVILAHPMRLRPATLLLARWRYWPDINGARCRYYGKARVAPELPRGWQSKGRFNATRREIALPQNTLYASKRRRRSKIRVYGISNVPDFTVCFLFTWMLLPTLRVTH